MSSDNPTTSEFKLSVCIPVFNGVLTIERAILSIVKIQQFTIELVIVDNNSNDGTLECLIQLSKLYRQIKIYRNPDNIGFALNYYKCLSNASGQYVTFCGADDVIQEDGLRKMVDFLDARPDLAILSGEILIFPNGSSEVSYLTKFNSYERMIYDPGENALTEWAFNSSISSIGGYIIRREFVNEVDITMPKETFYPMLYVAAPLCLRFPVACVDFVCYHQVFTNKPSQMANKQYLNLKSVEDFIEIFNSSLRVLNSQTAVDSVDLRLRIDAKVADSLVNNLLSYAAFGGYLSGLRLIALLRPKLLRSQHKIRFYMYSFIVIVMPPMILKSLLFTFRKNRSFLGSLLRIS
jgi:glycosyltransferase involved in cell wall biosynthesis